MSTRKQKLLKGDAWHKAHPKSSFRGGRPPKHIDVGTRFGRLEVIGDAEVKNKRARSICKCDCGNTVIKNNSDLKHGLLSCGCLLRDAHTIHGGSRRGKKDRLWSILQDMKTRCGNPKSKIYKYYGGKGISVCKEWLEDYSAFKSWAMANGYDDSKSIDRINNDGNYEPSNCRWVSHREQCYNKSKTVLIEIDGVKKNVLEWCKHFGIEEKLARSRMSEGKKGAAIFAPRCIKKGGK